MKVAIVGSRKLSVQNLQKFLPDHITEIVSGGAKGIDTCAKQYAYENQVKLTEFLPDYQRFGRRAPLVRNDLIIQYSDLVLVFGMATPEGRNM